MAFDFKFPDVGEGIHEGKIVKWLVKEGDEVKADQAIAEIETDKAVVEIPAPQAGKIARLYHKEGEMMKVGEVMATFEGNAASGSAATEQGVVGSLEPTAVGVMKAPVSGGTVFGSGAVFGGAQASTQQPGAGLPFGNSGAIFGGAQAQTTQQGGAAQQGLPSAAQASAQQNQPTTQQPVQAITQPGPVTQPAQSQPGSASGGSMAGAIKPGIKAVKKYDLFGYIDRAPYDGMRKTIGDHMVKSVFTAPHVTHMDTVEVTNLWALREREKAAAKKQGIKLTFLAYILKATVEALMKHPFLNAMLDEQNSEIILKKYYNIGVAVDTEAGLMVPVLKGADKKEVTQIAKEIVDLAEKARSRKINPMDLKGGTFTITNVGSAGSGKFFTPVINFPEAAILGIGLIEDAPVAVDGKVAIRKILYLSLSFDHRILDGAEAARFVKDLKDLLQAYGAPATTAKDASPEPSGLKKKTPAKRLIAM